MCVSCDCRTNSVSVLCVFVFLPPNFCKSVVCVYLLPCFAAKPLLLNFCECVVCACLSCVCHCVCVGFLVAKLLCLHFMFCMILFGTCFALVRPALVVLFVSRLLCITIVSFLLFGSFRVGKFFCICFPFVYFTVCLFLSRWLFVSFVRILRLLTLVFFVFVFLEFALLILWIL